MSERTFLRKFKDAYPGACWLGWEYEWYCDPPFGGSRASFTRKTGAAGGHVRPARLESFAKKLADREAWIWKNVQSLPQNCHLIPQLKELLVENDDVYHVSPLAPGASFCRGVPLLLLLLLLLLVLLLFSVSYVVCALTGGASCSCHRQIHLEPQDLAATLASTLVLDARH
jgi:hypothetical protein